MGFVFSLPNIWISIRYCSHFFLVQIVYHWSWLFVFLTPYFLSAPRLVYHDALVCSNPLMSAVCFRSHQILALLKQERIVRIQGNLFPLSSLLFFSFLYLVHPNVAAFKLSSISHTSIGDIIRSVKLTCTDTTTRVRYNSIIKSHQPFNLAFSWYIQPNKSLLFHS